MHLTYLIQKTSILIIVHRLPVSKHLFSFEVIESTSGYKYTVGSSSNTLYPAAGGSDDWAKAQGVKYSYTVELSDTGRYGFVLPTTYIEPVAKGSLAALRVLAEQVNKE